MRLYLAAPHYRSAIEYSPHSLTESTAQLQRIDSFLARAGANGPVDFRFADLPEAFAAAMDDDLSTPAAVAVIFETVKQGNRALEAGDQEGVTRTLRQVRAMLHIFGLDPHGPEWTDQAGGTDLGATVDGLMKLVLEQRAAARARKDWSSADAIRDALSALGLTIRDTPSGATWSF